jgi:hypothetical protein
MTGIEIADDGNSERPLLHSISRLLKSSDSAALRALRIRENLVDLEHAGNRSSTLTNRSGPILHWQAAFSSEIPLLKVNGSPVRSTIFSNATGAPVCWIIIDVDPGATVVVNRP